MITAGRGGGMIIAIPLTKSVKKADFPYTTIITPSKENGLTEESVALVFQLKSLDESRFKKRIGYIEKQEQRNEIDDLMRGLLKLR